jgi:hypothetical protein
MGKSEFEDQESESELDGEVEGGEEEEVEEMSPEERRVIKESLKRSYDRLDACDGEGHEEERFYAQHLKKKLKLPMEVTLWRPLPWEERFMEVQETGSAGYRKMHKSNPSANDRFRLLNVDRRTRAKHRQYLSGSSATGKVVRLEDGQEFDISLGELIPVEGDESTSSLLLHDYGIWLYQTFETDDDFDDEEGVYYEVDDDEEGEDEEGDEEGEEGEEGEDSGRPENFDYEAQEARIEAILGGSRGDMGDAIKAYFAYLQKSLRLPCEVELIEMLSWEEGFFFGAMSRGKFENARRKRPSSDDAFELVSLSLGGYGEWMTFSEDVCAHVVRSSDKRKFVLGLADLRAVDKALPAFELLDDYSCWMVNSR